MPSRLSPAAERRMVTVTMSKTTALGLAQCPLLDKCHLAWFSQEAGGKDCDWPCLQTRKPRARVAKITPWKVQSLDSRPGRLDCS